MIRLPDYADPVRGWRVRTLGLADYGVPVHICDDATPYEVLARLVA
jgi:hypothetical protein